MQKRNYMDAFTLVTHVLQQIPPQNDLTRLKKLAIQRALDILSQNGVEFDCCIDEDLKTGRVTLIPFIIDFRLSRTGL
jgi:hypothetical protein